MPIIPGRNLTRSVEGEVLENLLSVIRKISNINDLNNFLDRFMAPGEKEIFFQRLVVIRLLAKNKKYRDIKKEFRISGTTISKVKDILAGRNYSQNPDRKRKYSSSSKEYSSGYIFRARYRKKLRYKGTSGFLDPFNILNDL